MEINEELKQSKNSSLQNIKADIDQHLGNSIDLMIVNRLGGFYSVQDRGASSDSPVHLVPSHNVFLLQRLDGVQLPRLLKLCQQDLETDSGSQHSKTTILLKEPAGQYKSKNRPEKVSPSQSVLGPVQKCI